MFIIIRVVEVSIKFYLLGVLFNFLITSPIFAYNSQVRGWNVVKSIGGVLYFLTSWKGFIITIIKNI